MMKSAAGLLRPASVLEEYMTLSGSEGELAFRTSSKFTVLSFYPPSCMYVKHGLCTGDMYVNSTLPPDMPTQDHKSQVA